MRLFLYYALHTIKNQIRKLFRTWVVVFILICVVFGAAVGFIVSVADASNDEAEIPVEEALSDEDIEAENLEKIKPYISLAAGLVIAVSLVFNITGGSKNGSAIFQMADVNLLFAAPKRPQSVLFFRLMCQIGTMVVVTLYLGFQIPNLHMNLGLSIPACIALMLAWGFTMIYGKLFALLVYSVSSTHNSLKKYITPVTLGICAAVAAAFLLYSGSAQGNLPEKLLAFFNSPNTVYVPVWGWVKGIADAAIKDNIGLMVIMSIVSLAGVVVMVLINWNIKVDFYEDAMAKSEETAQLQERMQSDGKSVMRRKKDRSEKLPRNGKMRGSGASAFFYKEMYNRVRFAYMKIFTKTSIIYLAISLIPAALCIRFKLDGFFVIALLIGVIAFFRALASPLAKEANMDCFLLVPEKAWTKLGWLQLSDSVTCLLDFLPGYIIAAVLLKPYIPTALIFPLVIMSVDFYSSAIASAIDLSLPTSTAKTFKMMISVMFVYFGLLPDVLLVVLLGVVGGHMLAALAAVCAVNIGLGAVALTVSSSFIVRGKK